MLPASELHLAAGQLVVSVDDRRVERRHEVGCRK
jgi:hypothetical protein